MEKIYFYFTKLKEKKKQRYKKYVAKNCLFKFFG